MLALLGEIGFYDVRNFAPSAFVRNIESNWRRGIGVPFGFKAERLRVRASSSMRAPPP